MKLTKKQRMIMDVIMSGEVRPDGPDRWVDMDELVDMVPYETSKESMVFSVRYLIQKCLVVKMPKVTRRKRKRVPLAPTDLSRELFLVKTTTSVDLDEDVVLIEMGFEK